MSWLRKDAPGEVDSSIRMTGCLADQGPGVPPARAGRAVLHPPGGSRDTRSPTGAPYHASSGRGRPASPARPGSTAEFRTMAAEWRSGRPLKDYGATRHRATGTADSMNIILPSIEPAVTVLPLPAHRVGIARARRTLA